jgi:hypothetical protein
MAEMHHDERGYTVTLTVAEYDALKADLAEARILLEHFRFIAHGPGCICAMCERRTAFLAPTGFLAPKPAAETGEKS